LLAQSLAERLQKKKRAGKTLTLKIKYSDFIQETRSKTGAHYLATKGVLFERAKELLYQEKLKNSVRLIGLSVSNLNTEKAEPPPVKKIEPKKQLLLPF